MKSQEMCEMAEAYLKKVIDAGRPIKVQDIADAVGVGMRQLQRAFRAARQTTPKQWELRLRTTTAIGVYAVGGITEKAVAAKYGFSDSCHFCRAAKKVSGKSPMELRDEHRRATATA